METQIVGEADAAMWTNQLGSVPDIEARLTLWAEGEPGSEAAVWLLIAHGNWLQRHDFLDSCVRHFTVFDHIEGIVPVASIAFGRVDAFLETTRCSNGEDLILRLAARLAGSFQGRSAR